MGKQFFVLIAKTFHDIKEYLILSLFVIHKRKEKKAAGNSAAVTLIKKHLTAFNKHFVVGKFVFVKIPSYRSNNSQAVFFSYFGNN